MFFIAWNHFIFLQFFILVLKVPVDLNWISWKKLEVVLKLTRGVHRVKYSGHHKMPINRMTLSMLFFKIWKASHILNILDFDSVGRWSWASRRKCLRRNEKRRGKRLDVATTWGRRTLITIEGAPSRTILHYSVICGKKQKMKFTLRYTFEVVKGI